MQSTGEVSYIAAGEANNLNFRKFAIQRICRD